MYVPEAFQEDDSDRLHAMMREAKLSNFVTATAEGLMATPLPLFLDSSEGKHGILYGHLAKANPQWHTTPLGEALAIFTGPNAYVTPSWYPSKRDHGKVVPTWNYAAVHAYGFAEFFEDEDRLLKVVTHLTNLYEQPRAEPWAVTDAPEPFIKAQLKGIIGIRMPIVRIEGKCKMSQNRDALDRAGVAKGLTESNCPMDRVVADLIPLDPSNH